jgi:glycosyltransferase involved in cell wall biosynthesis
VSSTPVTVVIPLYNKAGEIRRCLDSVFAQSVEDFKVLVVDDGSTDDGGSIAAQTGDSRVSVVRQSNLGASAARNRGIAEANTEWVALLDADDEWKPGFLAAVLALRERFPEAGLWVTAYEAMTRNGLEALEFGNVPTDPAGGLIEDFVSCILKWSPVCSSNVLGRPDVFDAVGGFPEDDTRAEDTDTWVRVALRYPVAFVSEAHVVYHRDASNRVSDHTSYGSDSALARTLRRALQDSDRQVSGSRRSIRKALAKHLLRLAEDCIATGNTVDARRLCLEALKQGVYWDKCLTLYTRSVWPI